MKLFRQAPLSNTRTQPLPLHQIKDMEENIQSYIQGLLQNNPITTSFYLDHFLHQHCLPDSANKTDFQGFNFSIIFYRFQASSE